MGATRDFVSATVADALLPAFRRPVEDIIYETLDRRQIPTRTDFKEMRDLLNNLRGQVSGTSSGIRKVVERAEESEDILDQLDGKLTAIEERMVRLEQIVSSAGQVAKRLATVEAALISADAIEKKIDAKLAAFKASLPASVTPEQLSDAIGNIPAAVTPEQLDSKLGALPAYVTPEQLDEKLAALAPSAPEPAEAEAPAAPEPEPEDEPEEEPEPEPEEESDICKVDGCSSKGRARGFCARHYQRWRRGTLDEAFVGIEGSVTVGDVTVHLDPELAGEAYQIEDGAVIVGGQSFAIPSEE